jgi:hypothetical protein
MVLPERIELSTSPLPRECSTPELRQLTVMDGCYRLPGGRFETEAIDGEATRPIAAVCAIALGCAQGGEGCGRCFFVCAIVRLALLVAQKLGYAWCMSDLKSTGTGGKLSAREQREQRLADALRANLRRRKAQTRERRNVDTDNNAQADKEAPVEASSQGSDADPSSKDEG